MEPTFDQDGYPTEETLQCIREWKIRTNADIAALLEYCRQAWHHAEWGFGTADNEGKIAISTGGWSGNESIIGSLQQNFLFWAMCWESSRRGGHYEFDTKPIKETTK